MYNVIFASDLDRTLIYSKNSMGESIARDELVPVEFHNGNYISFMSKQALDILIELNDLFPFVPVTTRTIEQYQRVFYLSDVLKPKYAITSNGGNILVEGSPDKEWRSLIQSELRNSVSHLEVKAMYDELSSPEWALRGRLCDDLFYTMIIDRERMPESIVEFLRNQLLGLGWTVSIQGRKLYLVPDCVNKGNAIRHLKERLGSSYIAASGDSLLDESLLLAADYAIAPRHGELYAMRQSSEILSFTGLIGIRSSEELLVCIKEAMRLQTLQFS
ncbi:HAD family hydrolase [Paenibacillus thiaminolyticus]|uniref:HAD family hydrolase n=1 Tax=Paenibacillus thiaminolyticus TaxID=49283 RepID=UPI00232BAC19|nr:HAD family hydrolase [Paenibacillus thiaminolyticus]WCF08364.1 HAD family hydrolase [Paenibacillus thiaminolyticus]